MPESASFSKTWKRAAAAACALSAAILTGCRAGEPASEEAPPEMRFENVHFRSYRGPAPSSIGEAAGLVYRRDTGEFTARDAEVTLAAEGSKEVRIAAPVLAGDVPARSYEGRGGVRIVRGADTARTESARYGPDGIVRGDQEIEIAGPGYTMTGPSFTLDPARGELVVRGGVRLVATGERTPRP